MQSLLSLSRTPSSYRPLLPTASFDDNRRPAPHYLSTCHCSTIMGQRFGRHLSLTVHPTGRAWRTRTRQDFQRMLDDIQTEKRLSLSTHFLALLIWDPSSWRRLKRSLTHGRITSFMIIMTDLTHTLAPTEAEYGACINRIMKLLALHSVKSLNLCWLPTCIALSILAECSNVEELFLHG